MHVLPLIEYNKSKVVLIKNIPIKLFSLSRTKNVFFLYILNSIQILVPHVILLTKFSETLIKIKLRVATDRAKKNPDFSM